MAYYILKITHTHIQLRYINKRQSRLIVKFINIIHVKWNKELRKYRTRTLLIYYFKCYTVLWNFQDHGYLFQNFSKRIFPWMQPSLMPRTGVKVSLISVVSVIGLIHIIPMRGELALSLVLLPLAIVPGRSPLIRPIPNCHNSSSTFLLWQPNSIITAVFKYSELWTR